MPQSLSPDIKQFSGGHRAINTGVNPVVLRLFGCGIYDGMFENEKEFIERCCNHLDAPLSDTFIDLCENLSSFWRGTQGRINLSGAHAKFLGALSLLLIISSRFPPFFLRFFISLLTNEKPQKKG